MTIEGLGKKFQEARIARGLTLDEAARMTKIRPSRLAEIEGDDFSQFPSLAYAKGFLLIYGKFLDVDVTPYMEAFETSDAVTVDGYSYLQADPGEPGPMRTPPVRRRPERSRAPRPAPSSSGDERTSIMPLIIAVGVIIIGFFGMRFILNLARLAPHNAPPTITASNTAAPAATQATTAPPKAVAPTAAPVVSATQPPVAVAMQSPIAAPSLTPTAATASKPAPFAAASASATAAAAATATAAPAAASEPEVRRAEPVRAEDLKAAAAAAEVTGPNKIAIRPLKKTYIKVVIDDEAVRPAFERWVSPSDGVIEFRGQKFAVRVLDRDSVQIKKNGKTLEDDDDDVTVE